MNVALIVVVLFLVVALLITIYLAFIFRPPTTNPPGSNPCEIDIATLPSFNNAPCCIVNDNITGLVLVTGRVYGNYPTEPTLACSALCQNANYDPTTLTCTSGSSSPFQECVQQITVTGCAATALPVGVVGIQPYYLLSTDPQVCPVTGACLL